MKYPTLEEVNKATHIEICRWWRFLPSTGLNYIGELNFIEKLNEEVVIMNRIADRLKKFGGFTPEISKEIGWLL
mgnify:CR=1 FL=1